MLSAAGARPASAAAAVAAAAAAAAEKEQTRFLVTLYGAVAGEDEARAVRRALSSLSGGNPSAGVPPSRPLLQYERVFRPVDAKETESGAAGPGVLGGGGGSGSGNEVRAFCELREADESAGARMESGQWTLRHLGTQLSLVKHRCSVRPVLDVSVEEHFEGLLELLGFAADYEFAVRGHVFFDKNVEIRVFQPLRLRSPRDPASGVPLGPSWLVEASTQTSVGGLQNAEDALQALAQTLEGFVRLVALDPARRT